MQVSELWRTPDLILGDAMDRDVVWVEVVLRVHKTNLGIDLFAVIESHDPDLADTTHARV